MFFYMPAKVYVEENCVAAHAGEMASLGAKALIVTGRRSAVLNGSLADVQAALSAHGTGWTVFNEVEENPSVETVMRARDQGIREKADFVIGIGGGSPMDAAKAIALMLRHPEAGMEYMYDRNAATDPVPIVCIPTTCGTGSETTANAVLTRHDLHTKGSIPHKLFARLALLDGRYLLAAPHQVLMDTTMDALSHLYESYLNVNMTDCGKMCVDAGLKVWRRSRDLLLKMAEADAGSAAGKNGTTAGHAPGLTVQACSDMLLASMFAGMAVAHAPTTIPHGLSYTLTYDAKMPHGRACGYFLSRFLREADPDEADYLLRTAGFESADDLEEYFRITCGRDDVPDSVLERAVEKVSADAARLAMVPFKVNEAVIRRIAGLE